MSIRSARILLALGLIIILIGGKMYLLVYVAVFFAGIEFLNSRKGYTRSPVHRRYNAIFMLFILFIVLNRSITFYFSDGFEDALNLLEHGLFAVVMCLTLLCFLQLFGRWSHRSRMIIVLLAFNLIGLLNEVFQNGMNDRQLLVFEADARKDMAVNLIASAIFFVVARDTKPLDVKAGTADTPRSGV